LKQTFLYLRLMGMPPWTKELPMNTYTTGVWAVAFVAVIVAAAAPAASQQLTDNVVTIADAAVFVYDDVERFIHVMDGIREGADTLAALQSGYLDEASPGLVMFIGKYNLTAERLLRAIREYPYDYQAIGAKLAALRMSEAGYREVYADLNKVVTDAVFPPTYFLVGAHRGIGSGSTEGPLITIEKKSIKGIQEDLAATLVHEMAHMEQLAVLGDAYFDIFSGPGKTLLATSVREGVATLLSEVITGGSPHKNEARAYLLAHEAELWEQFSEVMLGSDMGDWLWSDPANPEWPRDLGYAMGARIAEVYLERADDRDRAVRDILAITDYEAFLRKSGYGTQFR
jgi:hypothetical protein